MAEIHSKRTSYPSKQPRFGPAPLASFEDLSDEIPSTDTSPEEESTAEARDIFDFTPDLQLPTSENETEDEIRTFSDGITPSTPRVLAQTPSTPLALSELGTPELLLGHSASFLSAGLDPASPKDVSSPKIIQDKYNIFSPRNSPIVERLPFTFNVVDNNEEVDDEAVVDEPCPITTSIIYKIVDPAAERALAAAQEERADGGALNLAQSSAASSLKSRAGSGTGSCSRVGSATPSPRSARKLFSMSFFKPREDRSPSPISSPKSPMKLSPMASPKSPRRSSPFGLSLFKSHGDQSPSSLSASPTKKKSHFPNFLRGKDLAKSPVQEVAGGKSGKHGGPGVFSTLFRRDHKDGNRADGKTPEEEEWISFSRTHLSTTRMDESRFSAISSEAIDSDEMSAVASTSSPNDPYHGGIYINIFERQSPTRDDKDEEDDDNIANIESTAFDNRLSNELLPRLNNGVGANYFESSQDFGIHVDGYDPALRLGLSPSNGDILERNKAEVYAAKAADFKSTTTREVAEIAIVPTTTFDHSVSASAFVAEEKLSPESERDDSSAPKYSKPDEPETETLLREDSFENDNESSAANSALVQMALEREHDLNEISKRRERIAKFQPHPVDRPRSILPLNYSSFEEYVTFVSKTSNSSSVSTEEQTTSGGSLGDGGSSTAAKLKVTLPKEEFQLKQRQSRKALFKSWVEFCEVGLQSPRTRRRHLSDKTCRSPSSMPASRTATLEDDLDRRTESLDYTLTGSGAEVWTTFEATHSVTRRACEISFESDVFASSKLSSTDMTDSISSLKSADTCLEPEVPSDSSRSSSPKEEEEEAMKICDKSHAFLFNLGDEEVEPLVKNVLSRDVSKEFLFDSETSATQNSPPFLPPPPPYAATTTSVITPVVLPVQRFDDDDDDKYLQQWWPADTPTLVSCAKQSTRAIPETNGKTGFGNDDNDDGFN